MKAVVWSKPACPYCEKAKNLLKNKGIAHLVLVLSGGDTLRAVVRSGVATSYSYVQQARNPFDGLKLDSTDQLPAAPASSDIDGDSDTDLIVAEEAGNDDMRVCHNDQEAACMGTAGCTWTSGACLWVPNRCRIRLFLQTSAFHWTEAVGSANPFAFINDNLILDDPNSLYTVKYCIPTFTDLDDE